MNELNILDSLHNSNVGINNIYQRRKLKCSMYHAWNLLEYSRVNGYVYPHVIKFTKVMLVLPATSVASSTTGNIITGQRVYCYGMLTC